MKLKPPSLTGTTSQAGDVLQRRIAERVTERWEKDQRKKRRAETAGKVKSFLAFTVLCIIVGGGFYLWRKGMLDGFLRSAPTVTDGKNSPASGSENVKIESMLEEIRASQVEQAKAKPIQKKEEKGKVSDRHVAFAESLKFVTIDYWRNAPEQDRPGKSTSPMEFRCVVPDENGRFVFLELRTAPHQPMKIMKVTASAGTVELTQQDFKELTSNNPYLIIREDRAYLSIPKNRQKTESYPVPAGTDGFNPSKAEFGSLYDVMRRLGMAFPDFSYDVYFMANGDEEAIPVATVGYGAAVTSDVIAKKVAAHHKMESMDESVIKALMRKGQLRFTSAKRQK